MKKNLFGILTASAIVALGGIALSPVALAGDKHAEKSSGEAMAKVGSAAPDFTLTDTNGKAHKLSDYTKQGKIVVLEWFNSECPYVKRHYEDGAKTMIETAASHGDKVVWLAINSGGVGKQGHGKDKQAIEAWKLAYPVLNDEPGAVGKLYGAKTTPHMFVIDSKGILAYAGAIDNNKDGKTPADQKVNYVRQALDEIIANKPVSQPETKPYGCSVKYAG